MRCYLNLVSQEARSYANRSNAMCCRYGRSDFGSCSSSIFQRHRDHVLCLESNDDGGRIQVHSMFWACGQSGKRTRFYNRAEMKCNRSGTPVPPPIHCNFTKVGCRDL